MLRMQRPVKRTTGLPLTGLARCHCQDSGRYGQPVNLRLASNQLGQNWRGLRALAMLAAQ